MFILKVVAVVCGQMFPMTVLGKYIFMDVFVIAQRRHEALKFIWSTFGEIKKKLKLVERVLCLFCWAAMMSKIVPGSVNFGLYGICSPVEMMFFYSVCVLSSRKTDR